MSDKQILTRENSKSVLERYNYSRNEQTLFPNFNLHQAAEFIYADPVVNGAEKQYVDKCMEGAHWFLKRDSKQLDTAFYDRMETDYQFKISILRSLYSQAFRFRNAFIEVVRGKGTGEVVGLNVLDAKHLRPITKPNGDVEGYKWAIADPISKKFPTWTKDEVIWLKFYDVGEGWSPVDIKALYHWVVLKTYVRKYVNWLWATGQYRVMYNFTDAKNKEVVDDFLAYMRQHDEDPSMPFVSRGELKTSMIRSMSETKDFIDLLRYCDQQILISLRVPPIDAGIPDASGRSNADAQSNNFITTVNGIKEVVKSYINAKLLPLLNKSNNMLVFAPHDRFSKKQIIDELMIFHNMGLSNDAKLEYLNRNGIFFETSKVFNEPEEQKIEKDIDSMPSRFSGTEGKQVESQGSGEASSTRADQLLTRSTGYPYVYDVIVEDD